MASTINADNGVVSGSSGLKSTADTSGVLALQSNGTTGLTLNTSLAIGVGSGNSTGSSGQVLTSAGSGAAPSWATVSAAPQAITYTNQSSNVTLTSANANSLIAFTLANDIVVTMPDATTLTSARNFTFKNNSTLYGIILNDAAGNYLMAVPALTGVTIWAASISTSAGAWSSDDPVLPYFGQNNVTTGIADPVSTRSLMGVASISSTQQISLYISSSELWAVVTTNTSGTITYGTPVLVAQMAYSSGNCSASMLTASLGVISFLDPQQYPYLVAFTVSGSTITLGTSVLCIADQASAGNSQASYTSEVAPLTTTTGAWVTQSGSAYIWYFSISGTTLTISSTQSLASLNTISWPSLRALSSTAVVLGYYSNTGAVHAATCLTLSGTTWTVGTEATRTISPTATGSNGNSICALSSTSFIFGIADPGNGFYCAAATVSGTTITFGAATLASPNAAILGGSLCAMSSTSAVATWSNGTYTISARAMTISGTTITMGGTTYTVNANGSLNNAATQYPTITQLQTPAIATPSATTAIITFNNQNIFTVPISLSGTTITVNTCNSPALQELSTGTSAFTNGRVVSISDTQFVVLKQKNLADGTQFALVASLYGVSGSTVTFQSEVTVYSTTKAQYFQMFPISSTLVGVTYGGVNACYMNTVSISGSTISLNTAITVDSTSVTTAAAYSTAVAMSSTVILSLNWRATGAQLAYRTINLSGTTLTANSTTTQSFTTSSPTTSYFYIKALSPTLAIFGYNPGTTVYFVPFTVSGTAVTSYLPFPSQAITTSQSVSFDALSATKIVFATGSSSTNVMFIGIADVVNGTLIKTGNTTAINVKDTTASIPIVIALTPTTGFLLGATQSQSVNSTNYAYKFTVNGSTVTLEPIQSIDARNGYVINGYFYGAPLRAMAAGASYGTAGSAVMYYPSTRYFGTGSNTGFWTFNKYYDKGAIN